MRVLREAFGERGSAYQQRHVDAALFEIRRRGHHLVRALDQQSGQADGVGMVFAPRLDQLVRRNLDAEVDHLDSRCWRE